MRGRACRSTRTRWRCGSTVSWSSLPRSTGCRWPSGTSCSESDLNVVTAADAVVAPYGSAGRGGDIANLKVQKLLYYAQGHYLAMFGRPLFDDPVQAWSRGPVMKDVYHQLERFGTGNVVLPEDDSFAWSDVDDGNGALVERQADVLC